MQYSNRADAKLHGHKTYFTGKPCIHGHIAPRITSSGACVYCNRIRANGERIYAPGLHVSVCLEDAADKTALLGFVEMLNAAALKRVSQRIQETRKLIL